MISKDTIDRITDTARIEDVVGEFVSLKKRGVNLIGLCPFHNEKTPSFNVNPARNIYKCFGCGKGGNAVNFIMEHEHYTYPEALRYLAKKYDIEIEESVPNPIELEQKDERESLYILNSFAQKTFSAQLHENEEGRSIGLSYFKERGFRDEIIEKFQLGYALGSWSSFSDTALENGYQKEYLVKSGLSIERDNSGDKNRGFVQKGINLYDRFRGRVIFPIHNLSGRVIGFGGRVLKKDEKTAKYINSPESDIYHKSKSLYGIFFARKSIIQKDNCYLAEGYTDVISLHQAGIENVVASSGTSLTQDQIRLIGRFTKNITVLYDSDAAGIGASLRGIDMILEEGLNVKVVLFPEGEDPDSYSAKHGPAQTLDYIQENSRDFVLFKTGLLLTQVQNDPVKKAGLIRDIVETISKIPDPIIRSQYVKQCSYKLDIQEQILIAELNKIKRQQQKKIIPVSDEDELLPEVIPGHNQFDTSTSTYEQERNIVRLLLNFHGHILSFSDDEENPVGEDHSVSVAKYIVQEIAEDHIELENENFRMLFQEFVKLENESIQYDANYFLNHSDKVLSSLAVELLSSKYSLSNNWHDMHQIYVPDEEVILKEAVSRAVYHLKNKRVLKMLEENQEKIKNAHLDGTDFSELLELHKRLDKIKVEISKVLNIDILK
ncbi:MAG: DNA primase [Bacteroidetes bacterium]|nr:MAG: DNA primase [Bacteroidota bacterium]REK04822.1 MAG: DNA primase [Bacteroidota bacterium]REK36294.1 MAG: DNA primase [Bacteroidota bacterium]REK51041.1 MAG: DNA primase [Bacteroidota bacterium]